MENVVLSVVMRVWCYSVIEIHQLGSIVIIMMIVNDVLNNANKLQTNKLNNVYFFLAAEGRIKSTCTRKKSTCTRKHIKEIHTNTSKTANIIDSLVFHHPLILSFQT